MVQDTGIVSLMPLKIGTIVEVFFISLLGYHCPILISSQMYRQQKDGGGDKKIVGEATDAKHSEGSGRCSGTTTIDALMRLARALSAGVLLGVAFLHLLVDCVGDIGETNTGLFSVAYAMVLAGIFVSLCCEQIALHLVHGGEKVAGAGSNSGPNAAPNSPSTVDATPVAAVAVEMPISIGHAHGHFHHDNHSSAITGTGTLAKAVIMEISVAIHSIIIGVATGLLPDTEEDKQALQILMIALAVHQFFEGFALGTAFAGSHISTAAKYLLGVAFAVTLPAGVGIGMSAGETFNDATSVSFGYLNAFACGMLIYVGLVEMIAGDFSDPKLNGRPGLKALMLLSFFVGIAILGVLAVWA